MIYPNKLFPVLSFFVIIGLLLIGCNHSHDHEGDPAKGEVAQADHGEAAHDHEKLVHLSEAQFMNAGIDTGWFEMKNLSEVINANGYTKLPPQNQAEVSIQFPGTIQTIKVIEGQYVKKGQTLATIQSLAYNNLRLEKARLNEQLHASESSVEYLRLEYERQKELSEENVTAKKVFQKISADLHTEESKIKSLKNQIAILDQNISIGGNSNSPVISIVAPISGNITEVKVTIGSSAETGKPLFHIVDNSKMHVDLLVYEKDLFKVKTGQNVRFILTNQDNEEIPGKIFSIGKSFESETKSVAVHADIQNNQMLIPGMYVNALIDIGTNTVKALPLEAVIKVEGREYIFIWEKENLEHNHTHPASSKEEGKHEEGAAEDQESHEHEVSFARVEVKTGPTQLGYIQVTPLSEIHNGDKVVVKGAFYLQSHLVKTEGGGGDAHQH